MEQHRIGILGGTFDPIHLAHIRIARQAYQSYHLDAVLVMPSKNPPHKIEKRITEENYRSEMIRLALKEEKGLIYSSFELTREGYTYTSDTLTTLHTLYPNVIWYFIIGGDSLLYLDEWHRPDLILNSAILLVALRGKEKREELEKKKEELEKQYPKAQILLMALPGVEISSTQIREWIMQGESDKKLLSCLPSEVLQYIRQKHLYQ